MDVLARLSKAVGRPLAGPRAENGSEDGQGRIASSSRVEEAGGGGKAGQPDVLRRRNTTNKGRKNAASAFRDNWQAIRATLAAPDQAALHHGIARTDLPARLQDLCDALVFEANRADEEVEVAGPCMEMLLEGDILGQLVKLTANDRLAGTQAEIVRLFSSLTILLDERFLSRQAVHRPLVRLMRTCVGDDFSSMGSGRQVLEEDVSDPTEDEEEKAWRRFGRNGSAEVLGFEEEFVSLMCHIASRLRNTPELLIIFFRERGGDDEARRAFNRAMAGAPMSATPSRGSTRPSSPTTHASGLAAKGSTPVVSSPLRPNESLPQMVSPRPGGSRVERPLSQASSVGGGLAYDFPLFSYLMRFVHRESRTGELARAGILFLVDVAFAPGRRNLSRTSRRPNVQAGHRAIPTGMATPPPSARGRRSNGQPQTPSKARMDVDLGLGPSVALARYMVDSDFAEVLGAGVGAVYGLLPTKLTLAPQASGRDGMVLGTERRKETDRDAIGMETDSSSSKSVRSQARLLCDLLEFAQDILRTTSRLSARQTDFVPSGDDGKRLSTTNELATIGRSLASQIGACLQSLFLESILYPSMLECSDMDGSAVAVMTYLDAILSVVEDDSPLADCLIGWITGSDKEASGDYLGRTKPTEQKNKKHKSTAMLQVENERADVLSSRQSMSYYSDVLGRYSMTDLIVDNLQRGIKPMAAAAALRLASTLFAYHGRFVLGTVLNVEPTDFATGFPSAILNTREQPAPGDNVQDSYEEQVHDNRDVGDISDDDFVYPGTSKERKMFKKQHQELARYVVNGASAWQYNVEMEMYLSLASSIQCKSAGRRQSGSPLPGYDISDLSTGFDNYIEDAEGALFLDSMYRHVLNTVSDGDDELFENVLPLYVSAQERKTSHRLAANDADVGSSNEVISQCFPHKLLASDRLLRAMIATLCCFWENSPDVNVALMGFLAALAACPLRSLEGLLTFEREQDHDIMAFQGKALDEVDSSNSVEESDEEDDRSEDERMFSRAVKKADRQSGTSLQHNRKKPSNTSKKAVPPVIASVLRALVSEVAQQRDSISEFDRFLSERRRGLLFVENLNEALKASGVDSGKNDAQSTSTSSPFATYDSHGEHVWKSLATDAHVDEGKKRSKGGISKPRDRNQGISLPQPPSATPSQGIHSSPAGAVLSTSSGHRSRGLDDSDAGTEARDQGDKPKEATGFARFFGRARVGRTVAGASLHGKEGSTGSQAGAGDEGERPPVPEPKPFAQHYLQTSSVIVNVSRVHLSRTSPWSAEYDPTAAAVPDDGKGAPVQQQPVKRTRFRDANAENDSDGDAGVAFKYPGAADSDDDDGGPSLSQQGPPMLLSTLLDNVVILEEAIKELVALLQVRRALGIDPVSFI